MGGTIIKDKTLKAIDGSDFYISMSQDLRYCDIGNNMDARIRALVSGYASSASNAYGGIYFGSGTTPAKREDCTLEAPISSGLNAVTGAGFLKDDGNGKYSFSRDFVLTNTTEDNITVSEIGCFTPVPNSTSKWYPTMMDRTVFPEPVVIQPGESKLFTYKFVFNQVET